MKKVLLAVGLVIAAAAPLAASARSDVSVSNGIGAPAPVYVESAPVYYAPPPPPRRYYYSAPRPVVVYQPRYYERRVVYRDYHYDKHRHGRGHRHHHHDD